jgi:hypothetical protein
MCDREVAAKPVGRLIWRWGWCSDGIKVEADRLRLRFSGLMNAFELSKYVRLYKGCIKAMS